ncbi:hypothetical protein A6769_16455 [Nostoc punctiforme NIES-2108]|uniref:Uncharacterized protein n=1 Tax=Nostoc punctiforme NIES-2108 TaxID=1356359 RepID=A0A367RLV9_NOSPU|nr:hypothetical protein A6769_16455 [Nostoc punctiforme NIES-2108]
MFARAFTGGVSKALPLGGGLNVSQSFQRQLERCSKMDKVELSVVARKFLSLKMPLWLYNSLLGWLERSAAIAHKMQLFYSNRASAWVKTVKEEVIYFCN